MRLPCLTPPSPPSHPRKIGDRGRTPGRWRGAADRADNRGMTTATATTTTDMPAPAAGLEGYLTRQRRAEHALEKQLFFIASCSKSGSTWLQHILDGHPAVCCHGEAFFPTHLRPLFQSVAEHYNKQHKAGHERNHARRSGDLTPEDARHLYRTAVATIFARWAEDLEQVHAIGDKTPENAVAVGQLLDDFPGSKIVHLIRDGRDVCVSGYFHNLREKGEAFTAQFPTLAHYIPLMAGQKWKPYILKARQAGAQQPERYLEVRYEALHTDPDPTIEKLLRFLGVDASAEQVVACREAGAFDRLSGGRDAGQENRNSFYRKGVIGDWREHFDDAARAAFEQSAGDLASQLGYA